MDKSKKGAPDDVMAQVGRKIGMRMGLIMNTFNTIIFSTIGTLSSGHFSWKGWCVGACAGWITGAIITAIVPPKKVSDWLLAKTKTDGNTLKGKFLSSLSTNFIIMPVMSLVMGVAMPTFSANGILRSADALEQEVVAMQQQQDDLKAQQADLISQRDNLKTQQDELRTKMEQTIEEAVNNALAERQASIDGLNASRSELQGNYDTMKAEVDDLQAQLDAAESPAEKGPLQGQIDGKTQALAEMQNGLDEQQKAIDEITASMNSTRDEITKSISEGTPEKPGMQSGIDEMQTGIDEMQKGIDGMQEGIDGMQQGIDGKSQGVAAQREAAAQIKGNIFKSLPLSILFMTTIGIILGMIFTPLFTKMVMRSVLGKDAVQ